MDREEAVTLLQQVYNQVGWGSWTWLHHDIDYESLRDYPPFRQFIRPKG
ncbi:MAG: hypothetical protein JSW71_20160 [Gemmatimonadota bacterium]|nr:MAG: hypothetical protein JSW71_20160 [Gemmatimonadota bacterium]